MNDELAPEVEALRKVPFFEDLTPEDLQRIAAVTILEGVIERLPEVQERIEHNQSGAGGPS
jgi:hypothetical protein